MVVSGIALGSEHAPCRRSAALRFHRWGSGGPARGLHPRRGMAHPFLAVILAAVAGALALLAVESLAPGLGSATGLAVMGAGLWGAGRGPSPGGEVEGREPPGPGF